MKIQRSKMAVMPLLVGLLFTILIAVACAPSPEYPEGSSQFTVSEDEGMDFGSKKPLFVIDLGRPYGVTEIYRGNDTLFYAIDPGTNRRANAVSQMETRAVLKKLVSEGYAVESIESNSGMLFIYLAGHNDTTTVSEDRGGILIPLDDIFGE